MGVYVYAMRYAEIALLSALARNLQRLAGCLCGMHGSAKNEAEFAGTKLPRVGYAGPLSCREYIVPNSKALSSQFWIGVKWSLTTASKTSLPRA